MKTKRHLQGFTLIELLIVIAIISIIMAVVFIALDPLTRFQDSRNAQRWSDVSNSLGAIKIDQIDNGGTYEANISGLTDDLYYTIGTCAAGGNVGCTAQTTQAACADLTQLSTEGYLGSVPQDPSTGTASLTDYYIQKKATGIVTIGACDPEGGSGAISISR